MAYKKLTQADFRYTRYRRPSVSRRYKEERKSQGTLRCDIPDCVFHKEPLVWNGKVLSLIVDHIDGNNSDNRVEKLRLLCPNCNAQQDTHGGRNRGKVDKADGGFSIMLPTGVRKFELPAESGAYKIG